MLDSTAPSVELVPVVPQIWPVFAERLQPHLEKMAKASNGRYLVEDIVAEIVNGRYGCYVATEGDDILNCWVFEFVIYPRCTAMRAIGVDGHQPRKWMHLVPLLELIAANAGCKFAEAMATPKHERLFLGTGGWEMTHQLWQKPLEVSRH